MSVIVTILFIFVFIFLLNGLRLLVHTLLEEIREQNGGEVSFTERGDNNNDGLILILRAQPYSESCAHGGA
jgi:hypothetical protein